MIDEVFDAISSGDIDQIRTFLDNEGDVNATYSKGESLLYHSIFFDHSQIAIVFLDAGADINQQDAVGRGALYWAILRRNQKLTNILLNRDAKLISNADGCREFRPIDISLIATPECISDSHQTWSSAETHPEFLPYIEEYLSIKKEVIDQNEFSYPIKILFYRSDSEVWRRVSSLSRRYLFHGIAACISNSRHILVNYDALISLPESTKETHLFHELGHCDLDRKHETKNAQSIMKVSYSKTVICTKI